MNWLSFDFFHETPICILQKDGVEHTDKCETHPASVKCAVTPLPLPWDREDNSWLQCQTLAVGTERQQAPASGWEAAPYTRRVPKNLGQSTHLMPQSCPSTAYASLALLAFTMQYLPTHFRCLSRFNPNRPGIFWFCLFFMSNAVTKLFLRLPSLFTVFFSSIVFFTIFLCRKTNSKSIGVLRSAQNWLHFVNVGRIRFALKPTASEKSHSALCIEQVTQTLFSALRKAVPEKCKAAGLWQRRNFLIIYVTMMRHRIQTG